LAIPDFYLFGRLNEQLTESALDSEENVLEMITETLSKLSKNEVKSALMHWKERCQWSQIPMESSIQIG
jgi:hypothetical protein